MEAPDWTGRIEGKAQLTAGALAGLAFVLAACAALGVPPLAVSGISGQASAFMLVFLGASAGIALFLTSRHRALSFLLGLLTLMVGWRVAALVGATAAMLVCLGAFLAYCVVFAGHARTALGAGVVTGAAIQLTFIRLYLGVDLTAHFTEKLFAGSGPRNEDVATFESLGVPSPFAMVLLAGVIELAAAIGVGLGLLTRLAAPATVIYLLVATIIGGHFTLGFIWATPGGGWEYPVLWSVLILTFTFGGGQWLSLDAEATKLAKVPAALRPLMARPNDR